jgi:hypothetical protein
MHGRKESQVYAGESASSKVNLKTAEINSTSRGKRLDRHARSCNELGRKVTRGQASVGKRFPVISTAPR